MIASFYVADEKREERILLVLDAQTGRELRRTKMEDSVPHKLAVSPDSKLIALLCRKTGVDDADDHIQILDLAEGKERLTISSPIEKDPTRRRVFSAAIFTPDSKSLVTSGGSDALIVWDAATGMEQRRLGRDLGESRALAFSPDGKTLAVAGVNDIRLIRLADGTDLLPSASNRRFLEHAILTTDGKTAITADYKTILLWDAVTGRELGRHACIQDPPEFEFSSIRWDGAFAYRVDTRDSTLHIMNLANGQESEPIKLEPDDGWLPWTSISPDNKVVTLLNHSHHCIQLRDSVSGKLLNSLEDPEMKVCWAHYTSDGNTLVACCADSSVRLWDVDSGKMVRQIGALGRVDAQGFILAGGGGSSYFSALSPDGKTIATGSNERCLVLYDLTTGTELKRSDALPNGVEKLAYSPDGRTIACTQWGEAVILLFEAETAKVRHSLAGHRGGCKVVEFSHDGKRLISGSHDTTAMIWDLTGRAAGDDRAMTAADLEARWADLAGDDATKAYRAIRKMALSPALAVPYLAEQLKPVAAASPEFVARLIAELDSDDFQVRSNAAKELKTLTEIARDQYERALKDNPPEETRRQLDSLIDAEKNQRSTGDRLRGVRAIEALEWAGTPEARKVLETLAGGAPSARLTQDAKASLIRISKQP